MCACVWVWVCALLDRDFNSQVFSLTKHVYVHAQVLICIRIHSVSANWRRCERYRCTCWWVHVPPYRLVCTSTHKAIMCAAEQNRLLTTRMRNIHKYNIQNSLDIQNTKYFRSNYEFITADHIEIFTRMIIMWTTCRLSPRACVCASAVQIACVEKCRETENTQ